MISASSQATPTRASARPGSRSGSAAARRGGEPGEDITAWAIPARFVGRRPVPETRSADQLPSPGGGNDALEKGTRNTRAVPTALTPRESRAYPEILGSEILGICGHGGWIQDDVLARSWCAPPQRRALWPISPWPDPPAPWPCEELLALRQPFP